MPKLLPPLLTLAALSMPGLASATPLESVALSARNNTLTLSGTGLSNVTRITITDPVGDELEQPFTVRGRAPTLHVRLGDYPPGSYRLRLYDASRTLVDQIVVAVPAPARALVPTAIRRVEVTRTCTQTNCTAIARCPAGYVATGGGFEEIGYYDTKALASRPDGATGWRVDVRAVNNKAHFCTARAFAVCVATGR